MGSANAARPRAGGVLSAKPARDRGPAPVAQQRGGPREVAVQQLAGVRSSLESPAGRATHPHAGAHRRRAARPGSRAPPRHPGTSRDLAARAVGSEAVGVEDRRRRWSPRCRPCAKYWLKSRRRGRAAGPAGRRRSRRCRRRRARRPRRARSSAWRSSAARSRAIDQHAARVCARRSARARRPRPRTTAGIRADGRQRQRHAAEHRQLRSAQHEHGQRQDE